MALDTHSSPLELQTMHWELKAAAVHVPQALHDRIARRLRLALSHIDSRVGRVVVYLRDLNGPDGGIDKSVRILAHLDGAGIALAMVIDSSWEVAVDRATDRIGANVARQLIRHRQRSSRACGAGT